MIHVFLSPAKNLNEDPERLPPIASHPDLVSHSSKIQDVLKTKKPSQLMKIQGISMKLADLNWSRNQEWTADPDPNATIPAALMFNGEVYQGLSASKWEEEDWKFANAHLSILSGLYGILRPADQILPYRLEMGTPLKVSRKKDLYAFWRPIMLDYLRNHFSKDTSFIDLSSTEYFKVVRQLKLPNRVIDVKFLDRKNGVYKPIQFWMKKARGTMASWIIRNRIHDPADLIRFDEDGYYFSPERSEKDQIVFIRDEQ
ncbi:MAG: peroxide stress protein YaaA [Bacteroidota bacterium]|nr:peroxide stress protein YaaA [Bacteroidota bacterium]MDX5448341.1 peroxide stress protein YaaA [Bacteroidota bacterium]